MRKRLRLALALYAALTVLYLVVAGPTRLGSHTAFNHFALLADAFVHGRTDLAGPPPDYALNNDFALFDGRWFVVFPPFPALLLMPWVLFAGGAASLRDGLFFTSIAGLAPAVLFLAFERLRDAGRSVHGERTHLALAALFGIGSVYWFCAEQGTVWYAAHVVGATAGATYLLFAIDAQEPFLAGLALACGLATRTPLAFAVPFFVFEAVRISKDDRKALLRRLAIFGAPIAASLVGLALLNHARFGSFTETGYRHLTVAWHARIEAHGLFAYRYLARNLGVLLTSLPFPGGDVAPFRISPHGIALWLTTPAYLLLLRPERVDAAWKALALTALAVALPSLFYQNSGQIQFGYRFSNDYAPFLFALLVTSRLRFGRVFWLFGAASIVVNGFGAFTFQRPGYERFTTFERGYALYPED